MPIRKHRPRLSLLAPRVIEAGREAEVTAVVDCPAALTVRSIDLEVVGRAVRIVHGQYGEERARSDFYRAGTPVFEGGELAAGRRELGARFRLPAGLPGSYRGKHVQIEYLAAVEVDIPWWPDAEASFELHVAGASTPARPRPTVVYSDGEGPGSRRPYFELAMPTTELVAGTRLEIATSFSNLEHARYRSLELDLIALESSTAFLFGGTSERSAARWVAPLDALREGEPVHARLLLPHDLTPSFELETVRLSWILRARARVSWGRDAVVELPVTVHTGESPEGAMRAPPEVGSERVTQLWRQVGVAAGLTLSDGVLAGAAGGARLAIRRELTGRGPRLVGAIEFADLHIGLRLQGRRREPAARDQQHSRILADALGGAFGEAGVVEASDQQIRCAIRGNGTRKAPLAGFIAAVTSLANELDAVRSRLPPPGPFAGEIDAWREAARALGARLEEAGPALTGERDGLGFHIAAAWDPAGEVAGLEVCVRAPAPIDRRHHRRWDELDPLAPEDPLLRFSSESRWIEIDRDGIRACYRREGGLERAHQQVGDLAALARELCRPPGGGAYR